MNDPLGLTTMPLTFLAAVAFISLAFTPLMLWYAQRYQLHDQPGPRRSHQGYIARGGGAIAVLCMLLAVAAFNPFMHWAGTLLAPILAVAIIGWLDDHNPQPVIRRLLVQAGSAAWLWWSLPEPALWQFGPLALNSGWLWPPLAILIVVWLINLYNFMDGSHGLAAGEAIFAGAAGYWLLLDHAPMAAALGGILAAAVLGFLPWNFPRPRIFMGDVASGVLGLCVGAMCLLAGPRWWPLPLLLSSVFVVDTTFTLLDRMRRRQTWYSAHREHVYQRLIQHGWSHHQVWACYMAINLLFILPVALYAAKQPAWALPLFILTSLILALAWWFAIRHLRQQDSAPENTAA